MGNAIQHEGHHEIKISGLESFFELLDGIELWRHGWDVGIVEKGGKTTLSLYAYLRKGLNEEANKSSSRVQQSNQCKPDEPVSRKLKMGKMGTLETSCV